MRLLVLGLGYTAAHFANAFVANGGTVTAVRSRPHPCTLTLDAPELPAAIRAATHILSSVPPASSNEDPVLAALSTEIAAAPARWVGYLSSTGVYGDAAGAWVDEASPCNGRRSGRLAADQAWQKIHSESRVFRLPGIYGPTRSTLDRLRNGPVARINLPGHVFSRIHVEDITGAMLASLDHGAPGIYNLSDTCPAPGEEVTAHAARLLGLPVPPLQSLEAANLSPMGSAFYAECRRVANGKMTRDLRYKLRYPDYQSGLAACLREMQP
nr:SDR family NAD(P)-dependent oxidoreductase [Polymorphobacter sp.]